MKRKIVNKESVEIYPNEESKCENCRWYLGNKECAAFNKQIPDKIWNGNHDKVEDDQSAPLTYNPKGNIL